MDSVFFEFVPVHEENDNVDKKNSNVDQCGQNTPFAPSKRPNETSDRQFCQQKPFNETSKHIFNTVIVLTSHGDKEHNIVRLERVPCAASSLRDSSTNCLEYEGKAGVFQGVMVVNGNKKRLTKVCKPHARGTFYVHARNKHSADAEMSVKKEKRTLSMWTYNAVDRHLRVFLCSRFLKHLLEPETFPPDMLGFIKKVLMVMREVAEMRRVELKVQLQADPSAEAAVEVPLIENFITVLTPALYDYQYLPEVPVSRKRHVCFRLKAAADAHVALSYVYGDTERRTYEVVIGGRGNTSCAIRYGGRGEVKAERRTPKVLDGENYRDFWVDWQEGAVRLGAGSEVGKGLLVQWRDIPVAMRHAVNLLSVSTGPGSTGKWEFVEHIVANEVVNESKREKRKKLLKKMLWFGKKEKIMQRLEEAFPAALSMSELLRLSTVSISNMLEAVVFLKKTHEEGSVLEVEKGVWLRSPFHPSDPHRGVIRGSSLPVFPAHNTPTIAIITSLFVEKTAVESMLSESQFFAVESKEHKTVGGYSIGRMGGKVVVVTKLQRFCDNVFSQPLHAHAVETLLEHFKQVTHVFVVGVAGAVPHFSDVTKHTRRGDVILSCPREHDGAVYVHCPSVEDDLERDASGRSAVFATSYWNAGGASRLQQAIKAVVRSDAVVGKQAWRKCLADASERLSMHDQRFLRPALKSDKLFCQLSKQEEVLAVEHPTEYNTPSKHLHSTATRASEAGVSRLKMGTIGSGSSVSRDLVYRRLFAQQNSISAYDIGLSHAMEGLFRSRIGAENVAMVLGVSDYLNGAQSKSWQPYAGLAASAVCRQLLQVL